MFERLWYNECYTDKELARDFERDASQTPVQRATCCFLALMYESLHPQTLHVIVVSGLRLLRSSEVIGFPSMTLVMVTCVM